MTGPHAPAPTDRITDALERARWLDGPSDAVRRVTGVLRRGPVVDALSGRVAGHPLHPVLVTVPLGALTGAWALSFVRAPWSPPAARWLTGLGVAAVAPTAVTGWSDWNDTEGAERRVGIVHAGVNVLAVGAASVAWGARSDAGRRSWLTVAVGVLGVGGWLGGHLAYAQGVGVDTTAFTALPQEWVDAGPLATLTDGEPQVRDADGVPVLLLRHAGRLTAMLDRCTHRGAPLHEGRLVDGCVECPWHASLFAVDPAAGGRVVRGPATRPAPVLQVREHQGRVQVRADDPRALRENPV